jgi:glucose/mannose-6-phosphate isomerase
MLDDLKYIHQKDQSDGLGIARRQASQLTYKFNLTKTEFGDVQNIVFAGMGGSALPALLATTWPELSRPFQIVREYSLPNYVNSTTLTIISSCSGNTEETLSCLAEAEAKGSKIAVIAGGGKLADIAKEKGYLIAQVPNAGQPRYTVFAMYRAALEILDMAGVVKTANWQVELAKAASFVERAAPAWGPEIPTANNPAKQLAQELIGKSVVIYAGPKLFPAAYKWKISCNENAKHVAWCNQYPEFNHNEFIGWSQQPVDKPYSVVDLRSDLEHPRIQRRFEVTERMLSGLRPAPLVVEVQGGNILEQMLWSVVYGDFTTLYLALLNGLDPAPVDLVERFKKALDN